MVPIIKICNDDNNSIIITDLTQDSSEYVSEDIQNPEAYYEKNKFKYSETCTVNIIQQNTVESEQIIDTVFTDHISYLDEIHYKLNKDGFYTIHHFILPSLEWFEKEIQKEHSILEKNIDIYICDCENIYHYCKGELVKVDPEVIVEVNTNNTTISKISIDQFSIYYLYNCYINLCKQIFQNTYYKCFDNSNLKDINFKRDFIWMAINVIKYYVGLNQLLEAQRLLEEINYCGGICNERVSIKQQRSRCGCNK